MSSYPSIERTATSRPSPGKTSTLSWSLVAVFHLGSPAISFPYGPIGTCEKSTLLQTKMSKLNVTATWTERGLIRVDDVELLLCSRRFSIANPVFFIFFEILMKWNQSPDMNSGWWTIHRSWYGKTYPTIYRYIKPFHPVNATDRWTVQTVWSKDWDECVSRLVVSKIFVLCTPKSVGKWSNLTFIFFSWVGRKPPPN